MESRLLVRREGMFGDNHGEGEMKEIVKMEEE